PAPLPPRPARPTSSGRGEPRTARQRTRTLARPAVEADVLGARGTAHGTPTNPHPCTPGRRGRPQRGRGELRTPTTTPPHPPPTERPTDRRSQPLTSPGRNPPHCRPATCSTDARSRSSAPSPTWTASRSSRWSPSPTGSEPPAAAPRR